jgi:hypothetical protein
MTDVGIPTGAETSLRHHIQTGSGAHASYAAGTRDSFPGVYRPKLEAPGVYRPKLEAGHLPITLKTSGALLQQLRAVFIE